MTDFQQNIERHTQDILEGQWTGAWFTYRDGRQFKLVEIEGKIMKMQPKRGGLCLWHVESVARKMAQGQFESVCKTSTRVEPFCIKGILFLED